MIHFGSKVYPVRGRDQDHASAMAGNRADLHVVMGLWCNIRTRIASENRIQEPLMYDTKVYHFNESVFTSECTMNYSNLANLKHHYHTQNT